MDCREAAFQRRLLQVLRFPDSLNLRSLDWGYSKRVLGSKYVCSPASLIPGQASETRTGIGKTFTETACVFGAHFSIVAHRHS